MTLTDLIVPGADPDSLYEAFTGWVAGDGLTPYAHQDGRSSTCSPART
jgi:hypothetical protein